MIVDILGLGESLKEYFPKYSHTVIGVNEVGHMYECDYVYIMNSKAEFLKPRWNKILNPIGKPKLLTYKQAVANQLKEAYTVYEVISVDKNKEYSTLSQFKLLNKKGEVRPNACFNDGFMYYSQTSPFAACMYAVQILQAKVINLYGVDMNTHKAMNGHTERIQRELKCWKWFIKECIRHDINVSVSGESRLVEIINEVI